MADCIYCKTPAGLMKKAHRDCKQKHFKATEKIIQLVSDAIMENPDYSLLAKRSKGIASTSYIDGSKLKALFIEGYGEAVERAFDDGVLSEEEESSFELFQDFFKLTQEDLSKNDAIFRLTKGAILREVLEGKLPKRIEINGQLPFNFQKSESLVWLFKDVDYYEEKTRTRYVGGSRGVSVRIAKGVYYRAGAFKGERIKTSETIHADNGLMAVTNKHLYFSGNSKRFRVKFDKIVAFEPFSDGIGIQKDAATAKPQSFKTGEGWFTYNLITNLANL